MTRAPRVLRLGTRNSPLARWQAQWVAARLEELGHVRVDLVGVTTTGDQRQDSLATFGGQGVFTKEIQRAVLDGQADLAVHSLKDLPTEQVPGLTLAAVPGREPIEDCLISRRQTALDDLPAGAVIATGSPRRRAQLWHRRRDLQMADVRGNVETRLAKLQAGQFDALVLAHAGLKRLGLEAHIAQVLPPEWMLPAVGQGALAVECREDDAEVCRIVGSLDQAAARAAVTAERSLLATLRGGCLAPVAAWGRIADGQLILSARVLARDGSACLEATQSMAWSDTALEQAQALGQRVAEELLRQGAAALIAEARP